MGFTRVIVGGSNRECVSLVVMGLLAGAAACGGKGEAAPSSSDDRAAAQFALTISCLPTCGASQDGEVWYVWSESNFYVCRGSTRTWVQTNLNGLTAAASVTAVSPGNQCQTGGSSIEFGLDLNRNGKLDNSEVTATVLVCNGSTGLQGIQGQPGATGAQGVAGPPGPSGSNGTNGAPGVSSLIRQDTEPAGANCPAGGMRIECGLDLNGSGTLDPSEVTQTSYTCNGQNGQNGSNGQNGLATLMTSIPEPLLVCASRTDPWPAMSGQPRRAVGSRILQDTKGFCLAHKFPLPPPSCPATIRLGRG